MKKATDPTAIAEIQKLKRQIDTQDRAQSQIEFTINILGPACELATQSAIADFDDRERIRRDEEFNMIKAELDRFPSESTPIVAMVRSRISENITTIDVSHLCSPTGMLKEFIECDLRSKSTSEKALAVTSSLKKNLEAELEVLKPVTNHLRTQVQELEKVHGTVEVEIEEQRPPVPVDPAVAKLLF